MVEWISLILIFFICACAVASVAVKELISASLLLSCFSFFLAILWALLAAPDVAFTEAVVGAGASTIFLILALFGSGHVVKPRRPNKTTLFAFLITLGLGLLFLWGSTELPGLGDPSSVASTYLSPYYLEHAYEHTKTPNVVTAVVVDYRGFDTLIEATVIFTAGAACLLIMKRRKIRPEPNRKTKA